MIAYVKEGKIVKLEGDPENPRNWGHLCAKGLSGFMNAYSPRRVKRPLLRTNPEKGLGVDPKWKEISWDEAITLAAERAKRAKLGLPGALEVHTRVFVATFDQWDWQGEC